MPTKKVIAVALFIFALPAIGSCPGLLSGSWPEGAVVYVTIDSGTLDSNMQSQIQAALTNWNNANSNCETDGTGNCSGVYFLPTPQGATADYFLFGSTVASTNPASSDITQVGSNVTFARTWIYLDAVLSDGVTPAYKVASLGYGNVFTKVAMHEIGHTMGLADVKGSAQTPGQTVMNQLYGTNDSGNYMASKQVAQRGLWPQPKQPNRAMGSGR
jgi:hypothetical protein